jgi:hypothetical protein
MALQYAAFENQAIWPAPGKRLTTTTVFSEFSGLVKANISVKSVDGSAIDLGPST